MKRGVAFYLGGALLLLALAGCGRGFLHLASAPLGGTRPRSNACSRARSSSAPASCASIRSKGPASAAPISRSRYRCSARAARSAMATTCARRHRSPMSDPRMPRWPRERTALSAAGSRCRAQPIAKRQYALGAEPARHRCGLKSARPPATRHQPSQAERKRAPPRRPAGRCRSIRRARARARRYSRRRRLAARPQPRRAVSAAQNAYRRRGRL